MKSESLSTVRSIIAQMSSQFVSPVSQSCNIQAMDRPHAGLGVS